MVGTHTRKTFGYTAVVVIAASGFLSGTDALAKTDPPGCKNPNAAIHNPNCNGGGTHKPSIPDPPPIPIVTLPITPTLPPLQNLRPSQPLTPTVRPRPDTLTPTVRPRPDTLTPTVRPQPDTLTPTVRPQPDTLTPTVRPQPDTLTPTVRPQPDTLTPTVRPQPDTLTPTVRPRPDTLTPTVRPQPDTLTPTVRPTPDTLTPTVQLPGTPSAAVTDANGTPPSAPANSEKATADPALKQTVDAEGNTIYVFELTSRNASNPNAAEGRDPLIFADESVAIPGLDAVLRGDRNGQNPASLEHAADASELSRRTTDDVESYGAILVHVQQHSGEPEYDTYVPPKPGNNFVPGYRSYLTSDNGHVSTCVISGMGRRSVINQYGQTVSYGHSQTYSLRSSSVGHLPANRRLTSRCLVSIKQK